MFKKDDPQPPQRPRLLLTLMVGLAVYQASAAGYALNTPREISEQVALPMSLWFVSGVMWAVTALYGVRRLWRRERGSKAFAGWVIVGFSIYSALRLFLYAAADYDRGRLPFLVIMVGLILLLPARRLVRRFEANANTMEKDYDGNRSAQ